MIWRWIKQLFCSHTTLEGNGMLPGEGIVVTWRCVRCKKPLWDRLKRRGM